MHPFELELLVALKYVNKAMILVKNDLHRMLYQAVFFACLIKAERSPSEKYKNILRIYDTKTFSFEDGYDFLEQTLNEEVN